MSTNCSNVDAVSEELDKVVISDVSCSDMSICANCGKEGNSDSMNTCNKCKEVKYCNATCKKKHRPRHKKKCQIRAAELHEEALFKQPPKEGDCDICMLPLPFVATGRRYQTCCGKNVCSGCMYACQKSGGKLKYLCAFCRTKQSTSDRETMKRLKVRVEAGDAEAIFTMGCMHYNGLLGCRQDQMKALEFWHQSAELGFSAANCYIGNYYGYANGRLAEFRDKYKAKKYYELGAITGDAQARYNLGVMEEELGNFDRAIKHWFIAVSSGYINASKAIQNYYSSGRATKDDFEKALRLRQVYVNEIQSDQRDTAAAADREWRYY